MVRSFVYKAVHGLSPTVELSVVWRRDDRNAVIESFLRVARDGPSTKPRPKNSPSGRSGADDTAGFPEFAPWSASGQNDGRGKDLPGIGTSAVARNPGYSPFFAAWVGKEVSMSQQEVRSDAGYPVDPDFDPLAPDYLADPYPYYARFREEAPIFYAPTIDFWVISRYEDIARIVKDPETFSNKRVQEPLYPLAPEALENLKKGVRVTPTTSTADPPLHKRTRKHAARAFSARRVASLEGRVREVANGLIDGIAPEGRADMVSRFAFPLPASVVFTMIGYPEEDTEMLKHWCSDRLKVTWGRPMPEEQLATVEKMASFFDYIEDFVHRRAEALRDDYTSDLLRIRAEDEENLSMEEVVSICYSLSFAGHETTTNLILNGLRQLLSRPGLWDEMREDPSLIENAVEEVLRRDTSVVAWRRSTTRPVEICGVEVPEGARLMLLLASANRDEEVFEDPDDFDIRRENANKHLAFSHGIHFCLGAPLARLEARVAFELLTRRLPDLHLSPPDQDFEFDPNMSFRGPKELWAEWTPA